MSLIDVPVIVKKAIVKAPHSEPNKQPKTPFKPNTATTTKNQN